MTCTDLQCLCADTKLAHCVECGELTILTRPGMDVLYTQWGKETRQAPEPYCGCEDDQPAALFLVPSEVKL